MFVRESRAAERKARGETTEEWYLDSEGNEEKDVRQAGFLTLIRQP